MKEFEQYTDSQLTQEIRQSNKEAFKVLYLRYYEKIYQFLWYKLYSDEKVRDFVQEVFTRIWQKREILDPKRSVKAYLYKTANNIFIDSMRKRSSKIQYLSELSISSQQTGEDIETRISIATAVAHLPEKQKTVFILSRYQGLKYSEIAEVCKISIKTVESRMAKALEFLRNELK